LAEFFDLFFGVKYGHHRGCFMPSTKPFWIAPGTGRKRFPERLVQAGYELRDRIVWFSSYVLRDASRAPEFIENAIQFLSERKAPGQIELHANPGGLLYARVRALVLREKRQSDKIVYYSASDLDDRFGSTDGDDVDEKIDTARVLSRLAAQLKPQEKELLKLLLMDYDVAEIAKALGISRNAAYKRRRKLILKARALL
jgi:DNA-binding CsgD family transcriptional regulator